MPIGDYHTVLGAIKGLRRERTASFTNHCTLPSTTCHPAHEHSRGMQSGTWTLPPLVPLYCIV